MGNAACTRMPAGGMQTTPALTSFPLFSGWDGVSAQLPAACQH